MLYLQTARYLLKGARSAVSKATSSGAAAPSANPAGVTYLAPQFIQPPAISSEQDLLQPSVLVHLWGHMCRNLLLETAGKILCSRDLSLCRSSEVWNRFWPLLSPSFSFSARDRSRSYHM